MYFTFHLVQSADKKGSLCQNNSTKVSIVEQWLPGQLCSIFKLVTWIYCITTIHNLFKNVGPETA